MRDNRLTLTSLHHQAGVLLLPQVVSNSREDPAIHTTAGHGDGRYLHLLHSQEGEDVGHSLITITIKPV